CAVRVRKVEERHKTLLTTRHASGVVDERHKKLPHELCEPDVRERILRQWSWNDVADEVADSLLLAERLVLLVLRAGQLPQVCIERDDHDAATWNLAAHY